LSLVANNDACVSFVSPAADNYVMLAKAPTASSLPDVLTVIGSAGSVVGGAVALALSPHLQRRALENLALGAAVGGVCAWFAVFVGYLLTRIAT
jgi:hypothetical protein